MTIFNSVYWWWGWGGWEWKPWDNTIAYFPLDSVNQLSDITWHYTLTKNWTVTFTDNYASFWWSGRLDSNINTTVSWTIVFWLNSNSWWSSEQVPIAKWGSGTRYYRRWFHKNSSNTLNVMINDSWSSITTLTSWVWYLIAYTIEWVWTSSCTQKVYVNGSTIPNVNITAPLYNDVNTYVRMWWWHNTYNYNWKLSKVILESKVRTAQEISDYYDQTKWDYWL